MRSRGIITMGALLLLAGAAVPASAQLSSGGQSRAKPQNSGGGDQGHRRRTGNDGPSPQGLTSREAPQPQRMDSREQGEMWRRHRAQNWRWEHHGWGDRGGYRGFHIPDDRFRPSFGRDHWFRIYSVPMILVDGWPRFQYGGYWFRLVDPWPEGWADEWWQSDDVSIDYVDDGYYLCNRNHPDERLALRVYEQ